MGWQAVDKDPNSQASLQYRRRQLEAAWREEPRDRFEFIRDACDGKRVVEVGCVDHDIKALNDPNWLHPKVAAVARECVGIDVNAEGIRTMAEAGFDVVVADITEGAGPLAARCPFDVVVAGEVIEHLDCPRALLDFALVVLSPGGTLVVSTPNPYAPWRVRAGHIRQVYENVDHVTYIFPSGMAELADRTGMILRLATTVDSYGMLSLSRSCKTMVRGLALRLLGRKGAPDTGHLRLPELPALWPTDIVAYLVRNSRAQMGETAVYVLEKPGDAGG